MKRILALSAGAVVLIAGGWSALWFAGRGTVEEAIDLELERLARSGVTVETGPREIGGFPFGYTVTAPDVSLTSDQGLSLTLPSLLGMVETGVDARVTLMLPPTGTLTIEEAASLALPDWAMPPAGRYDLTFDQAVVTLGRAPAGSGRGASVTALGIAATPADRGTAEADEESEEATQTAPLDARLSLGELEATIVLPQPGPDAMRRTVATAATLSFSRVEGDGEQNTGRLALDAEGLVVTSRIALGPEPRDRRISLQSGPLTARLSAGMVPGARVAGAEVGGSLDITAATAAALATLTDGAMEATTTLDEITATLAQTDPEALGGDGAARSARPGRGSTGRGRAAPG